MKERRSLVEGVRPGTQPADPARDQAERDFVWGEKERGAAPVAQTTPTTSTSPTTPTVNRSQFSTRLRTDFSAALKRASLERQLNGIEPHTLQDILEQAIEPWLKSNGYLS
ncbi:MAG: hypothetical protein JSS02_25790 [Planctomycetes bacterium]|nr:hypothetical protein [Planctomycetota bacterium]